MDANSFGRFFFTSKFQNHIIGYKFRFAKLRCRLRFFGHHYYLHTNIRSEFLSANYTDKSLKENRAFNPYFHTGHKFYGAMDYYHVGYSHGNVGLSDNYLNVHYKHGNGYSIGLTFHQFFTPNKVGKENHG